MLRFYVERGGGTAEKMICPGRKKALTGLGLLALLLVLFYALSTFKGTDPPNTVASFDLSSIREELSSCQCEIIFSPESNRVSLTMEWLIKNQTAKVWDQLIFRTYAQAYRQADTSPAASDDLFTRCYPDGFSPGGMILHDLTWNGQAVSYSFDERDGTVLSIKSGMIHPGEHGRLRLRCLLEIPDCRHRFGRSSSRDQWFLGSALPTLACHDGNSWRIDPYLPIGDPFILPSVNWHFKVHIPSGYQAAVPFRASEQRNSDSVILTGETLACRDPALVFYKGYVKKVTQDGPVELVSFAKEAEDAQRALTYSRRSLDDLSSRYGAYPWPSYTVAMTDLPFEGVEYSCLSMIGQHLYKKNDALETTIVHETAHQWFGLLVGSDQINHPWQDEALCEYAVLRYVLKHYGKTAYDQLVFLRAESTMQEKVGREITPGSPLPYFSSMDEYSSVVYGRGLSAMLALETAFPDFQGFLAQYCQKYAFRLATKNDFSQLLCEYSKQDLNPLLIDYIDTAMQ